MSWHTAGPLLPGCEHHNVDSWHVPTQEAVELVKKTDRPYGWKQQFRAEMDGDVTKWMWPGLLVLLLVSILIKDYLLIVCSIVAMLFFLNQARSVIKAMRAGTTIRAKCSELELVDEGKKTKKGKRKGRVWHAHTRFDGKAQEILVTCPEFERTLKTAGTIEMLLITDPDNSENNWLVGYRPLPAKQ